MFKSYKIKKDKARAKTKFNLFKKFIDTNSKIIDIGCGSGQFALELQNKNHDVTAVDVNDKTNTIAITPVIYDGLKLPFKNNQFNICMLITVLHHCHKPNDVFAEAVRVSKDKIFVLEDVYSNWFMKRLTWFMDSLMNYEFIGHPHTNKSENEWEKLFKLHNLKLIHKKKVKILLIFSQVVYVLEK